MGGKSKAPPAPNYQPIATADEQAAQLQANTANQQMAWAQQQFAQNQAEIQPLVSQETQAATAQNQQAQASYNRYTNTEIPLQNQYLAEAEQYNNPAYAQQQAGTAVANTDEAYTGARNNNMQQLQTYGVDPGTARSTATNAMLGSQEAGAKAAAATASTQNTRMTGLNLQGNAENMMAGLPGQSTEEYGGANSAGSTASGNALGLTNSGASTMGTSAQYMGLEGNSLNSWGNTLSSSYNAQLSRSEYDASIAEAQAQEEGQAFGAVTGALAKGGRVPGYAHGGMAIPDNLSYARGGAVRPAGYASGGIFRNLIGKFDGSGSPSVNAEKPNGASDAALVARQGGTPQGQGTIVGNAINNAMGSPQVADGSGGTMVGDAINARYQQNQAGGGGEGAGYGAVPMGGTGPSPASTSGAPSQPGGIIQPIAMIPLNYNASGQPAAKGGPIMPRGAGRVPAFHVPSMGVKVFKPHLMTNSHPHTSSKISVGPGGSPRMSAGMGVRGAGDGARPASAFAGIPTNIDSKSGGLPAGSGGDASAPVGAFAEGGAIPSNPQDPYGRADNISMRVKPGSYIIPKSVVDKKGSHHFDKIIAQHGNHEDKTAAHLRLQGISTAHDQQTGAPIQTSGGEFVMPKSVVDKLGTHHFDKIVAKEGDHTDRQAAEARLAGQPSGPGNGPPIPANQLAAAAPAPVKLGAIPMGAG